MWRRIAIAERDAYRFPVAASGPVHGKGCGERGHEVLIPLGFVSCRWPRGRSGALVGSSTKALAPAERFERRSTGSPDPAHAGRAHRGRCGRAPQPQRRLRPRWRRGGLGAGCRRRSPTSPTGPGAITAATRSSNTRRSVRSSCPRPEYTQVVAARPAADVSRTTRSSDLSSRI